MTISVLENFAQISWIQGSIFGARNLSIKSFASSELPPTSCPSKAIRKCIIVQRILQKFICKTISKTCLILLLSIRNRKNLYKLQNLELKRISKENIQQINLSEIVINLDYFYISEKLKYYCTLLGWSKLASLDKKFYLLKK